MTPDDKKVLIMPSLVKSRRIGDRCLSIYCLCCAKSEKKKKKKVSFFNNTTVKRMNEYVSNILYQSLVCLMYKIITMICIVLSVCIYIHCDAIEYR